MEERGGTETWEQTATAATSLVEHKLQLPRLVLKRAHKVGPRRKGKPRTIAARFLRHYDREAAMRNGRKLIGTNICLNEDLCPASQAVKSSQFPLLKLARGQGKTNDNSVGRKQPSGREEGAVGGTMGDSRDGATGPAADGEFTGTEIAGAWSSDSGRQDSFPSLSMVWPNGTSSQSPATPAASSQRHPVKKNLRSFTIILKVKTGS